MRRGKRAIPEGRCRGRYCVGAGLFVKAPCPWPGHKLWNDICPMSYELLGSAGLGHRDGHAKSFDTGCPDSGRVRIHDEG